VANFIQGTYLRKLNYGTLVTTAAAAFPQTATATLFTVTGGNIIVTCLLGEVTTVIVDGIATTTALTSAEVGTLVTVQPSSGLGGALVVGSLAGSAVFPGDPFVVSAGTITWTTGASHTGAMKWYLTYIPLDDGASVS
jgi:hypothetical protein